MNEADTPAERIDPQLKAASWGVVRVATSTENTRLPPVKYEQAAFVPEN